MKNTEIKQTLFAEDATLKNYQDLLFIHQNLKPKHKIRRKISSSFGHLNMQNPWYNVLQIHKTK